MARSVEHIRSSARVCLYTQMKYKMYTFGHFLAHWILITYLYLRGLKSQAVGCQNHIMFINDTDPIQYGCRIVFRFCTSTAHNDDGIVITTEKKRKYDRIYRTLRVVDS